MRRLFSSRINCFHSHFLIHLYVKIHRSVVHAHKLHPLYSCDLAKGIMVLICVCFSALAIHQVLLLYRWYTHSLSPRALHYDYQGDRHYMTNFIQTSSDETGP